MSPLYFQKLIFLALKLKAKCSSENLYHTDRCYIPEDNNIHGHLYKLLFRLRYPVLLSVTITNIGPTALGGPWSPQAYVASDLYPGHPLASFYNPVSFRLPLPRQSILISVGHVLDLQGLSTISC